MQNVIFFFFSTSKENYYSKGIESNFDNLEEMPDLGGLLKKTPLNRDLKDASSALPPLLLALVLSIFKYF